MHLVTLALGVCLVVLGIVGYYATGQVSKTALIPTWFGLVFVLLGAIASKASLRKHAMHAAAALAVLIVFATMGGIVKSIRMIGGAEIERPQAAIAQAITAVLCVLFVILCVRSFVAARRARTQVGIDPATPAR